jgi:hypothetical protein
MPATDPRSYHFDGRGGNGAASDASINNLQRTTIGEYCNPNERRRRY